MSKQIHDIRLAIRYIADCAEEIAKAVAIIQDGEGIDTSGMMYLAEHLRDKVEEKLDHS